MKCKKTNESIKSSVKKLLPSNTKIEVALKSTTLSSCFNVKDKIDFENNHDLIYHKKSPESTCIYDYVGESDCRITERIKDHSDRDHTSNIWKHSMEKSHKNVNTIDLKIIDKNFHNNKEKRKIAEVLWIKDLRPTLNKQDKPTQLKLFN